MFCNANSTSKIVFLYFEMCHNNYVSPTSVHLYPCGMYKINGSIFNLQFALYSHSIQTTHNTYGSHVGDLQPKIGHKEILKIRMNTLHLDISYCNNNKKKP
jgi:hypothetical protein